MKYSLITALIAIVILSCNDASDSHTNHSDSSTHDPAHTASTDTAAGANTMMGIMNSNMQQMRSMASTGHPDHDFAAMMKIHHQGAVDMSQLLLSKGQDSTLKNMAQKMIDAQNKEIAEFNQYLSSHSDHQGGDSLHRQLLATTNMNMSMDHSGTTDQQFARMMIPHHRHAIEMSRIYLNSKPKNDKLKSMANKIISDQDKEIKELEAWLSNSQTK